VRSTFTVRRLYTAWDNLGDEERFFRGVDTLERHGIHPRNLLVYMLVGYDKRETWERVCHRFNRMVERDIRPFPMCPAAAFGPGRRSRGRRVAIIPARREKITMDVQFSKRQEQIVAEYAERVLEHDRPQFYVLLAEQLRGEGYVALGVTHACRGCSRALVDMRTPIRANVRADIAANGAHHARAE
jgi:hypothetical protein